MLVIFIKYIVKKKKIILEISKYKKIDTYMCIVCDSFFYIVSRFLLVNLIELRMMIIN